MRSLPGSAVFDHRPMLPSMARSTNQTGPVQLTLDEVRYHTGRGGPRHGAGRPRGPRPRVLHRTRERIVARVPLHVTIRLRDGLPSVRQPRFVRRFRTSLAEACVRHGFRVVHYSIQRDHVHLLIEAQDNHSIACGMKSVGARIGKLVNRLFERRGQVLDGRYHLRPLRTPLEVRRALRYVLLNHRHHAAQRGRRSAKHHTEQRAGTKPSIQSVPAPDPASSGRWFDGWCVATAPRTSAAPHAGALNSVEVCEVASPQTWLLKTGWRRHGLIDPSDVP